MAYVAPTLAPARKTRTVSACCTMRPRALSRRESLAVGCAAACGVLLRSREARAADASEASGAATSAGEGAEPSANASQNGYLTRSGLKYIDFVEGQGERPRWGDYVRIQYVAYTVSPDGSALQKEDTSYGRREGAGFLIHHGNGEMVLGLEEALHSMAVGGRRRAIVPADLAYNDIDLGPVPAATWRRRRFAQHLSESDGTVVFDIELLAVERDPDNRGFYDDQVPDDSELIEMAEKSRLEYAEKVKKAGLEAPDPDKEYAPYLLGDERAYPFSPYVAPGLPRPGATDD